MMQMPAPAWRCLRIISCGSFPHDPEIGLAVRPMQVGIGDQSSDRFEWRVPLVSSLGVSMAGCDRLPPAGGSLRPRLCLGTGYRQLVTAWLRRRRACIGIDFADQSIADGKHR